MKRFELTPEALTDLHEIWEFISADSFDAADRVLGDFYRAFGPLAEMPGIGHRRTDLTKHDLHFLLVHSYLVIYRRNSDPLLVVAILHAKRDVKKLLKKR